MHHSGRQLWISGWRQTHLHAAARPTSTVSWLRIRPYVISPPELGVVSAVPSDQGPHPKVFKKCYADGAHNISASGNKRSTALSGSRPRAATMSQVAVIFYRRPKIAARVKLGRWQYDRTFGQEIAR